jgi:hypothetical protein
MHFDKFPQLFCGRPTLLFSIQVPNARDIDPRPVCRAFLVRVVCQFFPLLRTQVSIVSEDLLSGNRCPLICPGCFNHQFCDRNRIVELLTPHLSESHTIQY